MVIAQPLLLRRPSSATLFASYRRTVVRTARAPASGGVGVAIRTRRADLTTITGHGVTARRQSSLTLTKSPYVTTSCREGGLHHGPRCCMASPLVSITWTRRNS